MRNLCVFLCAFAPLREKMILMDGVLIIDKPSGLTSHDVVARTRHILHERRVGHTGTLDPFATGVLVILLGKATRLAQFLSGLDKDYDAIIRLGYATDTGDRTGKPIPGPPSKPDNWTEARDRSGTPKPARRHRPGAANVFSKKS